MFYTWKRLSKVLSLKYRDVLDDLEARTSDKDKEFNVDEALNNYVLDEDDSKGLNEHLVEYFLNGSIEIVKSSSLTNSNKAANNENVCDPFFLFIVDKF
jgi:hypothetical protein